MIGATFYTYEPVSNVIEKDGKYYEDGIPAFNPGFPYFKYTTDLDMYAKKGKVIAANERFVPYTADVTEDLPGSAPKGMEPRFYANCKLLVERHGAYYQFYHEESDQVLRIAMNSHYYTPTQNK